MASARDEVVDVIVIGAGWSGLLSCKHAKEENLSVRVLEQREDLGGVWKYSDDVNITTAMKTSCTSSSSSLTEISDFPMPDDIGEFPIHWDIYNYLNAYAERFKLRRHIYFNTVVKRITKSGELWNVLTKENVEHTGRNIIVCAGVHQKPNRILEQTLLKDFKGEVVHSGSLKVFQEHHRDKRIMVIGGGETASDILDQWYPNVKVIIWCIPNGQHFFRKYAKILPHRKPQALDKASSRALKLIAPYVKSKPGLAWICRWTTNGSLTAYQGHGISEFRNNATFFHSFINKHAHALDYIDYKRVIPKGKIHNVVGNTIHFEDGSSHDVDVVIQCTGYDAVFPFLPPQYNINLTDLYKYVYHPSDTSLSFVGYVRPIVGSIPGISEMQARWVCRAISGRVDLVGPNERLKTIAQDQAMWQDYFKDTSRRISTLVEGYTYLDEVAQLSNCYPNYWQLFKKNPKGFFTAYFAPYNGCSFLLNEEEKQEQALRTLAHHSRDTISPLHLLLIILLRFILFDSFCDLLGTIKYKIQTSQVWQRVRDWRVIELLNYIWCTPKRLLFDRAGATYPG